MSISRFRPFVVLVALFGCLLSPPRTRAAGPSGDWPMWGGTPIRNMVSDMKGLPVTWDIQTKKNVRWMASLGSQSYGNPVVAGGKVFVGTNNEGLRDPKQAGDRGVLMAFSEKDGSFLWQITHEKLASGRVNDWPYQGVASSPLVEGDRLYYVSNRCELIAVDTEGFRDGENDGPYAQETLKGEHDGDIVWKIDMMEELGASPHNLSNSSPVSWGDLVYVSTSNGQDESHVNIPSPRAPAIFAVDKKTGKVVWEDASPGDKILHGQWAAATVAEVGGAVQVIHPQGDGWIRSFDAKTGQKLWEFDSNPKDSAWPKTRNELIATPVVYEGLVYIGNGQDPEHGEGPGHFYAIDPVQARRHHRERPRLALRQDPPHHLDRRDQGRHRLHRRLQRLPARARREDGSGLLDPRHAGRGLGLAAARRRQAVPRRRGRRRGGAGARQGEEAPRRKHARQLGVRHRRSRQRRAPADEPQPALVAGRSGLGAGSRRQ